MSINIHVYSHDVGDESGEGKETSNGEMNVQSVPRIGEHFYLRVIPAINETDNLRMKIIRIEHTTTVLNNEMCNTHINVIGVRF